MVLQTLCTWYCRVCARGTADSVDVVLQTLCTFGALLDGSVLLYVSWTMLVPPALGLAVDHRVLRGQLPVLAVLGLVIGGVAPLVALGTRSWPALRSLVYLVIWTGVEAVVQLWNAVRIQPEAATSWMRMGPAFFTPRVSVWPCLRAVPLWDASELEYLTERK